ncbi:MAG: hypothetical protein Athens101410_227 [Parcubacteria group bacterium Athens1014_10]|nr:MAG: hypothetical protein Athens101410_227 [Parcubacteria group bacterium Athens1014_10]TSD04757.1 MAG: hypothetical protein Athens071412_632 [Parcubacteria group bacterium Athens0714_12]
MFDNKLKLIFYFIARLTKEIFSVLLFFFLTLLFLEDLKPYFAAAYINLRLILHLCFIFGIITLLTSKYREDFKI